MITNLVFPIAMLFTTPAPVHADLKTGHYQRWLIADAQGYIFDVQNASTANGALIGLWSYWGGANQQWQLRAQPDGSYSIINGFGKLVTIENSSADVGAVVNQWDDANQSNQHFNIVPVTDQHYNIVNINSQLCIMAKNGGGQGAVVVQGACNDPASVWSFYAIDDSGTIVSP